jgi:xanthine dehydrogenase accessory factor
MSDWDWVGKAAQLQAEGAPFIAVTLIGAKGSTPRAPGAKMLVAADGRFFGTIGGGQLELLLLEDARKYLSEAIGAATRNYPLCFRTGQCCGGAVEAFFEILNVGPTLYLFGAGHVGQSLCQTLAGTPFHVKVIDPRPEWLQAADLPAGVQRIGADWRTFVQSAAWSRERTYVAVMTHDHAMDLDIIADVVKRPARFIGLIGSDTNWDRFQLRLAALGCNPDEIQRVQCPIGIARFGKAPREVAISAAAQLLSLSCTEIAK